MDGREGMALSGSAPYYLNRGISGSGHHVGSGGLVSPPGYKSQSNPNISSHSQSHSNLRINSVGSSFQHLENPTPPSFPPHPHHGGTSMAIAPPIVSSTPGEIVKKKRGRPRKYAPGGARMSLALSPVSPHPGVSPGELALTPTPKKNRGRPRGSGRKQRLADLGEWMNNSAGLAFTPHVIQVSAGEDVAAKILSFAQQRPRALCILSGNGTVSTFTLRQPTNSGGNMTYEGRFEILCLSGSYLVAETGSPRNRTGGISISVCSPDGHVLGGAIGGRLTAASLVQVVVCSFVYGAGGSKPKEITEGGSKEEVSLETSQQPEEKSSVVPSSSQNLAPNSEAIHWPVDSKSDVRNSHTEIDLTSG